MNQHQLKHWILFGIVALGWLAYLERPTKANLRRALAGSLPLL